MKPLTQLYFFTLQITNPPPCTYSKCYLKDRPENKHITSHKKKFNKKKKRKRKLKLSGESPELLWTQVAYLPASQPANKSDTVSWWIIIGQVTRLLLAAAAAAAKTLSLKYLLMSFITSHRIAASSEKEHNIYQYNTQATHTHTR